MRSCGSCSAWEKTEAGSSQSGNRRRTAARPSRSSPFRMHHRHPYQRRSQRLYRKHRLHPCQQRSRNLYQKHRLHPCQRRSQRPYRKHRLHPCLRRSRNPYSRSPKRSPRPACSPGPSRNPNQSRRSAAVRRSRLRHPNTAKHPAAADWGSGAKNRSTENRKRDKKPTGQMDFRPVGFCNIRAGSVPVHCRKQGAY